MIKTEKNLSDAFAAESQANRKYLAFAKQADKEGYPNVARLFRAIAVASVATPHLILSPIGCLSPVADVDASGGIAVPHLIKTGCHFIPSGPRVFCQLSALDVMPWKWDDQPLYREVICSRNN